MSVRRKRGTTHKAQGRKRNHKVIIHPAARGILVLLDREFNFNLLFSPRPAGRPNLAVSFLTNGDLKNGPGLTVLRTGGYNHSDVTNARAPDLIVLPQRVRKNTPAKSGFSA
jgi:hypothetical protein